MKQIILQNLTFEEIRVTIFVGMQFRKSYLIQIYV